MHTASWRRDRPGPSEHLGVTWSGSEAPAAQALERGGSCDKQRALRSSPEWWAWQLERVERQTSPQEAYEMDHPRDPSSTLMVPLRICSLSSERLIMSQGCCLGLFCASVNTAGT